MDTEKFLKFLLPSLKELQSKEIPPWLIPFSEFSMILKKTLKTDLPLKELLKTKDLPLMMNSKLELMVKSLVLMAKLLILEDKFSNYNSPAHHTNKAETLLKEILMMLLNLWVIEELDVKKKTTNSY
jgi:hypothetical protein